MRFLVYSEINANTIKSSMGLPQYSYFFVLRDFLPVLQLLGSVQVVEHPEVEVDQLYDEARLAGESCLFLSFSPPHTTPLGLRCPTIPIFAWEFDSIPDEQWLDDIRQNWCHVLENCFAAISLSQFTAEVVRARLGKEFPIEAIPAPVWDKFSTTSDEAALPPLDDAHGIQVTGVVLDTHDPDLNARMPGFDEISSMVTDIRAREHPVSEPTKLPRAPRVVRFRQQSRLQITRRYLGEWYLRALRQALPWLPGPKPLVPAVPPVEALRLEPLNPVEPPSSSNKPKNLQFSVEWQPAEHRLNLDGVVFTAVFNPNDGRKNWADMLTAFCEAFRYTPDATLVFKLGHHECQSAMSDMLLCIARLSAFQCRVILLQGFLEKAEFKRLIQATTFIVNASHGEGQCLPLMEFLSCGKPAIAPCHSAMLDYIDQDIAFVVDSWLDATAWPHDPRLAYRTRRHCLDWSSLVTAYQAAYDCVQNEPQRYRQMSERAKIRMKEISSQAVVLGKLEAFLKQQGIECS